MTGPEHYRKAEELIDIVNDGHAIDTMLSIEQLLAMAQVHATLALTAATAMLGPVAASGYDDADLDAWREAAGVKPAQHDGPCACDHHGDHAGCDADCECAR